MILLIGQSGYAQRYSTATASTGAEIIVPVGTAGNGEMITAHFYAGPERRTVDLQANSLKVNGTSTITDPGIAGSPTLRVISAEQAYSITCTFDPRIRNRENGQETIQIGSIKLLPVNDEKGETRIPNLYYIGTTLLLSPWQAPGHYNSGNPYQVTVHFN